MKSLFVMMAFAITTFFFFTSCEKERFIDQPGYLVPRTVVDDPNIPSITVNGVKLHSEAFGHPDSPMVVLIHGGPGSDYRYMLNGIDLTNYGFRVVCYDQRGSGLSQRLPKSAYTSQGIGALDEIYDELTGVIAHYRTSPDQKVYLLGHSWGAMLATAYTGKHPELVQGLVLMEPGGLKWEDVMDYVSRSRSFSYWGEYVNDVTFLDEIITGDENDHEILDYKFAMLGSSENSNTDTERGKFWRHGAVINTGMIETGIKYEPDFSEGIGNFNVPVMFFYSEKSISYPDEWALRITSVFNEVEICKVPGVGHQGIISNQDAWEQTTMPRILAYFNSL